MFENINVSGIFNFAYCEYMKSTQSFEDKENAITSINIVKANVIIDTHNLTCDVQLSITTHMRLKKWYSKEKVFPSLTGIGGYITFGAQMPMNITTLNNKPLDKEVNVLTSHHFISKEHIELIKKSYAQNRCCDLYLCNLHLSDPIIGNYVKNVDKFPCELVIR